MSKEMDKKWVMENIITQVTEAVGNRDNVSEDIKKKVLNEMLIKSGLRKPFKIVCGICGGEDMQIALAGKADMAEKLKLSEVLSDLRLAMICPDCGSVLETHNSIQEQTETWDPEVINDLEDEE